MAIRTGESQFQLRLSRQAVIDRCLSQALARRVVLADQMHGLRLAAGFICVYFHSFSFYCARGGWTTAVQPKNIFLRDFQYG